MQKVVIAIDSFKGSLSSLEAGEAARLGVCSVFPECRVEVLPIADGGEGLLEVLLTTQGGILISLDAHSPLMERCATNYGISLDGRTAFIEMARISGLPLVPTEQRNPMLTTSFGTGELIKDALNRGCREFIVGLGGSATNDAGLGMLQALGYRFYDRNGRLLGVEIPMCGALMSDVYVIDDSDALSCLQEAHFIIASDVDNPFCGLGGAAEIFAPQKGADAAMVTRLDQGMQHVAKVFSRTTGRDITRLAGSGAAGGMGGALLAFFSTTLQSGAELLLKQLHFAEVISGADIILTGEGWVDRQTLMGKVPSRILSEANKQHIPVMLLAGGIADEDILNEAGFAGVFSITPAPISLEQAMMREEAIANIKRTVAQLCRFRRATSPERGNQLIKSSCSLVS